MLTDQNRNKQQLIYSPAETIISIFTKQYGPLESVQCSISAVCLHCTVAPTSRIAHVLRSAIAIDLKIDFVFCVVKAASGHAASAAPSASQTANAQVWAK